MVPTICGAGPPGCKSMWPRRRFASAVSPPYAGRLPFALMGLACIFLVYQLVRHNFGDRAWALMAAALLACSVPFLLYARQCRYYSLAAFIHLGQSLCL